MTRLLIVEDNEFFRSTLAEILRVRFPSLDIEEYPTGSGALEAVRRFCPDIVLMDLNLPGEGGLELSRKIRSSYSGIEVIICTILDSPEYRELARNLGVRHFIGKSSTSSEELFRAVADAEVAATSRSH
ncbi:MAG: response regulator transcription factor [Deltaproteobacteria bacterium]|nr:response regulator transcription factor [Deltaproteobacteria bacterium]